ncbi:MAG: hypothetical protein ACOC46_01765 [Pirellulales bacterium]
MNRTSRAQARRLSVGGFVALQVAVLAVGSAWAAWHIAAYRRERALPAPPRNASLTVGPLYDDPSVVALQQLRVVLDRLKPRFRDGPPNINHVDHALRFWGVGATFDDPACLSGREMRQLLVDTRQFRALEGADAAPLLIDAGPGVRVRVQEGLASSSHVDHTLATLAEVGTSLSFAIVTPRRRTTYRALLEQSLRDFSLNQIEYEWSAIAYGLFLPPTRRWISREGQEITFDRLAGRIMREDLPDGVCAGNHRMQALVVLLRVDSDWRILSAPVRRRVEAYLKDVTRRLVEHQAEDGYWKSNWPTGSPAAREDGQEDSAADDLATRILATGHPMEWWALAPPELLPPRHVRQRAGQWLVRTIQNLTPEQIDLYYTFLSHAGHALSLWRGREPAQVLATR